MTDTLDTQIRNLVTELMDSVPQAPSLSELERRETREVARGAAPPSGDASVLLEAARRSCDSRRCGGGRGWYGGSRCDRFIGRARKERRYEPWFSESADVIR